ncbi:MAG TPA: valine--tRNA ligase [Candidatus Paceibacterota bacterium]|nr:valine--tRNA ligase [Candidatus Paceibacterota bacterium]
MPEELEKAYDSTKFEKEIYKRWEDSGFFNPDNLPGERKETFSIVLPPPNVTGILHMGSALMLAIEDILVRYQRMRGKKTLWVPGTDSAAIATQAKVEKEIQKAEGKNRHELGREELLKRIDKFIEENQSTMLDQIRSMGASVDWSRYAFTLDPERYRAVTTAFVRMFEAGLIERDFRVVNWDPKGQTTISDDEIVYEERPAKLYTFKYSKDFPISIATTRPETKVGDTGVAVHPDDKRYQQYIGQEFDLEFCGVPLHIKIVADKEVDPEFGTGAVGLTPAHSMTDWEIARRHDLPTKQVINEYAKMSIESELKDKKTTEAREIVVAQLKEQGLLEKEEDIKQNIATAERTGGLIEPLPKLQWFVRVNKEIPGRGKTLKDIMREPIDKGEIKIVPEHYSKTYFHWIDNLRDWCISRQIWFGHRIPIWYKGEEIYCGFEAPQGAGWEQDPDVLDTWFSSALWTFSTLGWPDETQDLKNFHPTTLIETGYDILFFWVARMILMSGFHLQQIPFKTIYLHGLVRDEKGQKISKSLGNNIDPVEMIEKYGADAVRMALIVGVAPGTDSKMSEQKIKGYRNFSNKLWNIARFVFMSLPESNDHLKAQLTPEDEQRLAELREITSDVTKDMEEYRFYMAAEKIYAYVWHTFADKIIEESKSKLSGEDEAAKASAQRMLLEILTTSLKLLHPFMPFITEVIYGKLPGSKAELLMIESWPLL